MYRPKFNFHKRVLLKTVMSCKRKNHVFGVETHSGIYQLKLATESCSGNCNSGFPLHSKSFLVTHPNSHFDTEKQLLKLETFFSSVQGSAYKGYVLNNGCFQRSLVISDDAVIPDDFDCHSCNWIGEKIVVTSSDDKINAKEYVVEKLHSYHPVFDCNLNSPVFKSFDRTLRVLSQVASEELLQYSKNVYQGNPSNLKYPFIVVEGLDGTGKSTMTANLAKHLNGVALRTPPEELCCFRKRFDVFPEMLRRSFYSFSNYLAARHLYDTLQTQPVVLDRFWHSTTSYAIAKETAFDCYLPPKGHSVYSWPTDLIRPSAVVFLTTPEKERDFRVNERQEITNEEQLISQNILLRERIKETYRRIGYDKWIEVDTSGSQKESLQNAVCALKNINIA